MDHHQDANASAHAAELAHVLATDSGVDPGYHHGPKRVTVGEPFEAKGVVLKWYAVHDDHRPIPEELTRLARARLAAGPLDARGLGFVILHRCGDGFYFLIVGTWRNSNELWETVFYKDGDKMADFAPWPREGAHIPMLCVWELVPAWHERQAWVRFLASPRDEASARIWLGDRYAGPA